MRNIVIGIFVLVLCFISFFMGYGAGISDPEPRETRELEKQIKTEELIDGSYGAKQDLLEIQGLITKREERETDDTVLGYLTAVDVFNRIRNHHRKTLRLPLPKNGN